MRCVLHVRLPPASPTAQARLLNVAGQLVRCLPLAGSDTAVPVAALPSGPDPLEVTTPTQTTHSRFMKECPAWPRSR